MKKAKQQIAGKKLSRASVSLALRQGPAKEPSAFDKAFAEKDCDILWCFLKDNPQEDALLWEKATYPQFKYDDDEFIAILLEQIKDPSNFDASKYLVQLAYYRFTDCATEIIKRFPFDVNYADSFRGSALTAAVRMDCTDIALMLLDVPGIDLNIKNANKRNPVWFAACNKNKLLLNKLIEMGADSLQPDAEDTLPEQRTTETLAAVIRDSQDLGIEGLSL